MLCGSGASPRLALTLGLGVACGPPPACAEETAPATAAAAGDCPARWLPLTIHSSVALQHSFTQPNNVLIPLISFVYWLIRLEEKEET